MIRNDIKNYIEIHNIKPEEMFFKHRNIIDQSIYRVGKIKEDIIVWNQKTDTYMDYFYDDSDQEWFELTNIIGNIGKDYYINRSGIVNGPKKTLKLLRDIWNYPIFKIRSRHYKLHLLLSRMFIPNIDPANNLVIDHLDRNKDNYSLCNLRWSTIKENANNIYRPNWVGTHVYKQYSDKGCTNLIKELSDSEIVVLSKSNKNYKTYIRRAVKTNTKFDNVFWKVDDIKLLNYLKSINVELTSIDESLWKVHYNKKLEVHPLGLVRNKRSSIEPTPGSLIGSSEVRLEYKYKKYRVHTLVAEVFLNNNKPLDKNLVIDHINTNPLDNRVQNLRICTQKENMNNLLTKEKLSKKIIDSEGNIYSSITECAIKLKVSTQAIWARLNGRRPSKGFRYLPENNQNLKNKKK